MGQTALSGTLNSLTMSLSGDLDLTVANFDAEDLSKRDEFRI